MRIKLIAVEIRRHAFLYALQKSYYKKYKNQNKVIIEKNNKKRRFKNAIS